MFDLRALMIVFGSMFLFNTIECAIYWGVIMFLVMILLDVLFDMPRTPKPPDPPEPPHGAP